MENLNIYFYFFQLSQKYNFLRLTTKLFEVPLQQITGQNHAQRSK